MANLTEIEVTYLAASLPEGLGICKKTELCDVYFPAAAAHAKLRIRQKGEKYELTKKTQPNPDDAGTQEEENVELTADEFNALAQGAGRKLSKTRYYLPFNGRIAEVDVFHEGLEGLVIVEFEFDSQAERDNFDMPDFCMADVTQDDFIAGGVLAGKTYDDVRAVLDGYNYKPLPRP